ncbi:M23 family metallopeptidase [bacterium]|nr:M23 family metallopeptidase [bacterium]
MNKTNINRFAAGAIITFAIVFLFSLAILTGKKNTGENEKADPLTNKKELHSPQAQQPSAQIIPTPSFEGVVGKNMNFFDLMKGYNVSPQRINKIVTATQDLYDLRRIYPGQSYRIFSNSAGRPELFQFSINNGEFLDIAAKNDTVTAQRLFYPFEIYRRTAYGIIKHSLYESFAKNNSSFELASNLNNIFRWDIDFFHDLRPNDYYRLIYEEKEINNPYQKKTIRKVKRILAAEFSCNGNKHYAFLFKNKGDKYPDYYNEEGKSLRKQLLKVPLNFTRISSRFSKRRYHPILHHYMPHLGIDYAAPKGTPVQAAGNGTVIKASKSRGNGNYIKIRHSSNYISYYLHLSKFAKGIKYGSKVTQGEIIGYVGATGYSTGPHLDYRIKKNGRFVNPRELKLPPAEPIADSIMQKFAILKDKYLTELNTIAVGENGSRKYAEWIKQARSDKESKNKPVISQTHSLTSH